MLHYYIEKMAIDRSYCEEQGWIHWKTSIGLKSAGSQKERKTEANLGKDCFGGRRKCDKTWSEVKRLAGDRVRRRCSQLLSGPIATEVYATTNAAAATNSTTTTTTTTASATTTTTTIT
jgi:hypothetical protein